MQKGCSGNNRRGLPWADATTPQPHPAPANWGQLVRTDKVCPTDTFDRDEVQEYHRSYGTFCNRTRTFMGNPDLR